MRFAILAIGAAVRAISAEVVDDVRARSENVMVSFGPIDEFSGTQ